MADTNTTLPIGQYETNRSCPLGTKAGNGRNEWIYVQFLDAVTYTVGMVCGPCSLSGYTVTNDVSGGTATALRFAGAITNVDASGNAVTAVPTQNSYGWLMINGPHSAIRTNGDDDIAAFDTVIMVATDGVVDSVASGTTTGTLLKVGIASAADVDASNTVAAVLQSGCW